MVASLQDHRKKVVLEHAGMYPRFLPSGHLVYAAKGSLFVAAFDPDRLEVRGASAIVGAVSSHHTLGAAQLDFSRNGTLAYRIGGTEGVRNIQWLDAGGKTESLGVEPALYLYPRLSPDGQRFLFRTMPAGYRASAITIMTNWMAAVKH